jgi:uncharacterized protein GlcG (DUF336 family)
MPFSPAKPLSGGSYHAIRTASAGGRVTSLGGGLPLEIQGQIVGGIAASARTSDENVEVAQAGLDALRAG